MDLREVSRLSDEALLRQLDEVNDQSNVLLADLLAHLGEVDFRKLYTEAACSSLFSYCHERLGMSEGAAWKRMTAARAGRRFPLLLELVEAGRLHLAGAALVASHLDEENHPELLASVEGKSKRAIERLLAGRSPKPDVPTSIRRVPVPAAPQPASATEQPVDIASQSVPVSPPQSAPASPPPTPPVSSATVQPSPTLPTSPAPVLAPPLSAPLASQAESSPPMPAPTPRTAPSPPRIEPLSETRYRVTFTVGQSFVDKLTEVQALLGSAVAPGDIAEVLERGLEMLRVKALKKKAGARAVTTPTAGAGPSPGTNSSVGLAPVPAAADPTAAAGPSPGTNSSVGHAPAPAAAADPTAAAGPSPGTVAPVERTTESAATVDPAASRTSEEEPSRYIPTDIRAAVWRRDEGRCTQVDEAGRRCSERRGLQYHHLDAWALFRHHSIDGIVLRCGPHNALEARRTFGAAHVQKRIDQRRQPAPAGVEGEGGGPAATPP